MPIIEIGIEKRNISSGVNHVYVPVVAGALTPYFDRLVPTLNPVYKY